MTLDEADTDTGDEPFTKITVEGKIRLGHRHELIQEPQKAEEEGPFVTVVSGPSRNAGVFSVDEDTRLGQKLETQFSEDMGKDLFIENAGLTTSFGIFGAPGCGKTVLLMHLLKQVLGHKPGHTNRQFGALILDPKAALGEKVEQIARQTKRDKDLKIINTLHLTREREKGKPGINLIDCSFDPDELGAILVLAARSAGADVSEPFWFVEWANLFKASLGVLRRTQQLRPQAQRRRPTLKGLLDAIFDQVPGGKPGERVILLKARELLKRINELPEEDRPDACMDLHTLERFFAPNYARERAVIEALMSEKLGAFRRSRLRCYSEETPDDGRTPFYEDIIQSGKIVLVSISPAEPELAKTLCTLIKCLFQRAVLARRELLAARVISNRERPVVIACDEYSEIASEMPGQSMGDGQFLALAREYGCMAILATQSVNVLEASSLKESWRSVFSNFAAKIYMRLVDNETAEEAAKLAGESDWIIKSSSQSNGPETTLGLQEGLRERKNLPTSVLTHVLKRGQAVVIGSLDGGETTPGTYYISVPPPPRDENGAPAGQGARRIRRQDP
jgi:hypothetical protein